MLKTFLSHPNHCTLLLLFAASTIELTGYFMLSPLLTLTLNERGIAQGVIGAFAAMSWLALLAGAPYAATLVARWGAQKTLRLCALLPLVSVLTYLATPALPLWFIASFVGSLASSLRWICSESVVAALSTDATRGRWVSGYSTLIGLTFIAGPALVSLQIASVGLSSSAPWWMATGLIVLGAALTFALHLPAAQQSKETPPRTPINDIWRSARSMPLVVMAGMMGGFFEVGINGILPLYGLQMGFTQASATLLVSVSAVGGITGVLAAGWLGGTVTQHHIMQLCASLIAAACGLQWLASAVPALAWLAWLVVFGWGAAGAALYIVVMVKLGTDFQGIDLVQRMAVLVMAYTLGGLFAPLLGGWALQGGLTWFHGLTTSAALLGLLGLLRLKSSNSDFKMSK